MGTHGALGWWVIGEGLLPLSGALAAANVNPVTAEHFQPVLPRSASFRSDWAGFSPSQILSSAR